MATAIPPGLLDRLWLYTNLHCNLRCRYCLAESGPRAMRARLEWPAFQALVDQAASLGFRQVALTGGEPFLHPHILELLRSSAGRRAGDTAPPARPAQPAESGPRESRGRGS